MKAIFAQRVCWCADCDARRIPEDEGDTAKSEFILFHALIFFRNLYCSVVCTSIMVIHFSPVHFTVVRGRA